MKEVSYKKAKFAGKLKTDNAEITLSATYEYKDGQWKMTDGGVVEALATASFLALTAQTVPEDENTTYYAGNGFKTVTKTDDGTSTVTWNANGLLTSLKGKTESGNANFTLKYSK